MRAPTRFDQRREHLDVQMTPMIDVVFLLLIYFVYAASFEIVEYAYAGRVELQQTGSAPTDEPPKPDPNPEIPEKILVEVYFRDGQAIVLLEQSRVADLKELKQRLAAIARADSSLPIIIHPRPNVPWRHANDVYTVARDLGIQDRTRFVVWERSAEQP